VNEVERVFSDAAIAAGSEIMRRRGCLPASRKADGSPVCDADLRAEAIIREKLGEDLPGVVLFGEEGAMPDPRQPLPGAFILVDPLDGTRDFLAGSLEFTVNIALVEKGRPSVGVVYAPALGRLFLGRVGGAAVELPASPDGAPADPAAGRRLRVRRVPAAGPLALESCSHREEATVHLLAGLAPQARRAVGSSLKFALIAAGEGDLYARGIALNAWDIAAGDAVLSAAGGAVLTFAGEPIRYDRADLKAPPFIAFGDQELRERMALRQPPPQRLARAAATPH